MFRHQICIDAQFVMDQLILLYEPSSACFLISFLKAPVLSLNDLSFCLKQNHRLVIHLSNLLIDCILIFFYFLASFSCFFTSTTKVLIILLWRVIPKFARPITRTDTQFTQKSPPV